MVKVRKAQAGKLRQAISAGANTWFADVPAALGGEGSGPEPHDLFDAALGACTALTVSLVAQRKQWPLEDVRVSITHTETDGEYRLHRQVELVGSLSGEQREYLLGIANKCPIHRLLHKQISVETVLEG
ncbi:MAG: OsmC family protein [Gammaproteobacteria bacterium]|jgi:putative redox protein